MLDDVLGDLKGNMDKAIESLKRDLTKVRTGRANLAILDGVRVDYYGTMSPLNQVASLQVADPRLIVIKPWEKSMCPVIERTVRQADLGLNPSTDGEVVRVPIPPLTEARRKELVKVVRRSAEEAKVAMRTHRREANEMLKEFCDGGDISEDDLTVGLKKVQDTIDLHTAKVDEVVGKKEKEILEV
ncbi:MAG: ribosome recycling factor [Myxococcota bacterium]